MKILIDTNILISASLNSKGTPSKAFFKAVTHPNQGLVCDQNIDELRRVYNRKFPDKLFLLERFLSLALTVLEVVQTPTVTLSEEETVRDVADRPILRAALSAKADVLLTGDRDFLESGLRHPHIMTAADFLALDETAEKENV